MRCCSFQQPEPTDMKFDVSDYIGDTTRCVPQNSKRSCQREFQKPFHILSMRDINIVLNCDILRTSSDILYN